jgi:hypothetical protein
MCSFIEGHPSCALLACKQGMSCGLHLQAKGDGNQVGEERHSNSRGRLGDEVGRDQVRGKRTALHKSHNSCIDALAVLLCIVRMSFSYTPQCVVQLIADALPHDTHCLYPGWIRRPCGSMASR